jgi:hypothetical protein
MQIQHVLEGYGLDNDSKAYVMVWNDQSTSNIFFKAIRCIASGSLQPTFLNEFFFASNSTNLRGGPTCL